MSKIQIIQDTEAFKRELTDLIKTELLAELKAEFQPKQPEEYLTRHELAQMLSVDLSTIHTWGKKGKINPIGIGARVYFRRSEIENAFVELNNI